MSTLQSVNEKCPAWISESVWSFLIDQADARSPHETGGVLLGYWAQHPSAPVITAAIGPGPRAVHEKHRFVPDYDYHEQEIARQYLLAGGALQYLGDWHTHPGQAGDLSTKDYATLARIAYTRRARAPQALMLILAHGPRWEPVLWRARKKKKLFYWRPCEVDQLTILRFTPD